MTSSDQVGNKAKSLEKMSMICWGIAGICQLLLGIFTILGLIFVFAIHFRNGFGIPSPIVSLMKIINSASIFDAIALYIPRVAAKQFHIIPPISYLIPGILKVLISLFIGILFLIKPIRKLLNTDHKNDAFIDYISIEPIGFILAGMSFMLSAIPGIFAIIGALINYFNKKKARSVSSTTDYSIHTAFNNVDSSVSNPVTTERKENMGMIFCRGCGKEIHESAVSCPKCGALQNVTRTKSSDTSFGFYGQFWSKGFDFSGRTRRRDYWLSSLINFGFLFFTAIFDAIIEAPILTALFSLGVLIPTIAISVRRLHDIGKSGLWCLLMLVPIIGSIALLLLCTFDSQDGSNIYGANPKGNAPTEKQ